MGNQVPDSNVGSQETNSTPQVEPNSGDQAARNQQAAGNSVAGDGAMSREDIRRMIQSEADKENRKRKESTARSAPLQDVEIDEYEAYRADGMSKKDALRRIKLNRIADAQDAGQIGDGQASEADHVSTPEPENLDLHGSLKSMGYEVATMSVEDQKKLGRIIFDENGKQLYNTALEMNNALTTALLTGDVPQPTGNPTQVNTEPGTGSAAHVRPAAQTNSIQPGEGNLQAEYDAWMAKVPQGNIEAITRLKSEFREKGLDVF